MDKKGLNERIQRQEADWRKERDQLIGRATDLEVEIKVTIFSRNFRDLIVMLNDRRSERKGTEQKRNTNKTCGIKTTK